MIIRTVKNANYTAMSNVALNDGELSLKAAGLWAFLMSKPDNWNITIAGIAAQRPKDGKAAIRSAIEELESVGYLVRGEQVRNEDGTFSAGESLLYELPDTATAFDFPTTDNPTTDNRTQVSTNIVSTKQVISTNVDRESVVYGKKEINDLFLKWTEIVGYEVKGQVAKNRQACNNLFKKYGSDGVEQLLRGVAKSQTDKYAPRVSDFISLQAKYNDLIAWGKRSMNGGKVVSI